MGKQKFAQRLFIITIHLTLIDNHRAKLEFVYALNLESHGREGVCKMNEF